MVYLLEGCWGPHHACQQTCQQAPPASRSVVVRQRGGPMHDLTGAFQLISTHKSPLWAVWTALLISATVHTLEGMSVSRAALALLFLVLTRASSARVLNQQPADCSQDNALLSHVISLEGTALFAELLISLENDTYAGGAQCKPAPCPKIYSPVCGVDGNTYDNDCLAKKSCGVEVDCAGQCPCGGGKVPTTDVICPMIFQPYCDVYGQTYSNLCIANATNAILACSGECPCPDPLVKVKEAAGTLIVPTDEVLTVMLDRANLTYDKVVGSKVQVQSLLALLTSLAPTLNLQQDHSIGVSEAGHRLQYEEQGMSGEPAILDMDADVELHIASIVPYCGANIVVVDDLIEVPSDYGDYAAFHQPPGPPLPSDDVPV